MSRFFGGRRLRPLLSKKHKDLRFAFDHVFDETSSQSEVFHHTTYSIIEGVLDGINCSIFAYGATGRFPGFLYSFHLSLLGYRGVEERRE